MRRVQAVRRATSRPNPADQPDLTAESTGPTPGSDWPRRRARAARDAEVADTLTRIDQAIAA